MSNTDPAAEETGIWTRHNISDHDDAATVGTKDLAHLVFDGSTGKWTQASNVGGGLPPVVAATAADGTSPPAPVVTAGGTDSRGIITYGSGSGTPTVGVLVTVTFKNPLPAGTVPFIKLESGNSATKALGVIPTNISNTGFSLNAVTAAPGVSQAVGTYSTTYWAES